MTLIKWKKKNLRFELRDIERLHKVFWGQNAGKKLMPWILPRQETQALVAQCRKNNVTVNTALWTAFLAAQHEVQSPLKAYHQKSGMAVSTREKLLVPVGEALGFHASSLTVQLEYDPQKSFWESDVNEKLIGVVTVGDRASFMMTYNEKNLGVDKAKQIRDTAMQRLAEAVGG